MFQMSLRTPRLRAFLALTLFAWIAGAAWHGAMRVAVEFGQPVCTAQGAKFVAGGAPVQPGQTAGRDCPLCAAFGAPASTSSFVAAVPAFVPFAAAKPPADRSTLLPASHLADLASRAPPRA